MPAGTEIPRVASSVDPARTGPLSSWRNSATIAPAGSKTWPPTRIAGSWSGAQSWPLRLVTRTTRVWAAPTVQRAGGVPTSSTCASPACGVAGIRAAASTTAPATAGSVLAVGRPPPSRASIRARSTSGIAAARGAAIRRSGR